VPLPVVVTFRPHAAAHGLSFQLNGKEYSQESAAAVKRRIGAMLDYLESIQEK
jgi:hypothetical protein